MISKNYRNFSNVSAKKNYYSVLGLKSDAASKDIRSAYLSLAKKYHPDCPTGSTEKFKQIAEAYEFLTDPRLKQVVQQQKSEATQQSAKQGREREREYYNYENSKPFEEDSKGYEEWRSNKAWSSSERHQNFEASGYQYYDPYLKDSTRYTYSQFKRDKYNKTYQKKPKAESTNAKEEQSKSSGIMFIFSGIGGILLIKNALNTVLAQSPEIYENRDEKRFLKFYSSPK